MNAALDAAYASCERIARSHYENFPVASILLPSHLRRHVAAVYAFARAADDFADEGERSPDERLRLLDGWVNRLHDGLNGGAQPPRVPGEPDETASIFLALTQTVREFALPPELLVDLISAFRQDVTVHRYQDWEELFDYSRRSANPVGRLVLRLAGYRAEALDTWSDAICTALQFTNFWQDFAIDRGRGRVYLPQIELTAQGVVEADLRRSPMSAPLRCALHQAVLRTRDLFIAGRPLCDAVSGRLRYELRVTWLGGMRILEQVERQLGHADVARPALTWRDGPWVAWRLMTWAAR